MFAVSPMHDMHLPGARYKQLSASLHSVADDCVSIAQLVQFSSHLQRGVGIRYSIISPGFDCCRSPRPSSQQKIRVS